MAVTKIKPIRATIEKTLSYITNPDKTESCLFVSSENCIPETAAIEFQFILDKARSGGNTIGRHLIQSFVPNEVSPEQAHEIGQKLAAEILGGQYAYVMATHVDRNHIHNHFVWCAVNIETHKKYVSNKASYRKIQSASDKLCSEYSLSVITEKSGRRGKSYTEYQADRNGASWKSLLRKTIDSAIRSANDFDEFLSFMKEAGYEVKHGKYISFRAAGQGRFTRAKTIGDSYTEERIRERITEAPVIRHPSQQRGKQSIRNIIDRNSEKVRSSPAYNQWASVHNVKAMAETHNYLAEHHDLDLNEFESCYADCINRRNSATAAFDEAARQIAANKSIGLGEGLKRHNDLKSRHAKEMVTLNTEIAEMERVRKNLNAMLDKDFHNTHSQKRNGVDL